MLVINLIPRRKCGSCTNFAVRGSTRCAQHNRLNKEGTKARIEKRKALGICVSCNSSAVAGHVLCENHIQKFRDSDQRRREQAKVTGRCQKLGCVATAVKDRVYCEEHLEVTRKRSQDSYQEFISQRRCKACGELSQRKMYCADCTKLSVEERRTKETERQSDDRCLYCGGLAERPLFTRTALTACLSCRVRLGYTNVAKARFKRAQRTSQREWSLSFDEYKNLVAQPCSYCELPQDAHERGTGLDRLNPAMGYHIDNVVSCCGVCNITRNSLYTVEEMKLIGVVVREIKLKRQQERSR